MATDEERDLILEMLASGKITSAEARLLFDTVERLAAQEHLDAEMFGVDVDADCLEPAAVRELAREMTHAIRHSAHRLTRLFEPAVWGS